ncbi:hypothetical protein M5K25_008849 [Dendrobium thyrsiflorum]|uniref:Uncharacterized protein n=1 Tax=Dendrobium thyrsiflorum TaxID=117978 RepID=A0ABD0V9R5_DENTH
MEEDDHSCCFSTTHFTGKTALPKHLAYLHSSAGFICFCIKLIVKDKLRLPILKHDAGNHLSPVSRDSYEAKQSAKGIELPCSNQALASFAKNIHRRIRV